MARAALIALFLAGCGATAVERPRSLTLGDGWAETPLDSRIARLACRNSECGVCRVRVHVVEPDGATRDVEHRTVPGARAVITVRASGSVSLRASAERGDEQLQAMLELEPRAVLDVDAAIRALAHPGSHVLEGEAQIVRTYEITGEAAYVLHEFGGAARTLRGERREELDGAVHEGTARASDYQSDTRAWMEGSTRRTESVHVREDARSTVTVTEELDERGRLSRQRTLFGASWEGGSGTDEREFEYDEGDLPTAVSARWGDGQPHRRELGPHPSEPGVERDSEGRLTRHRRVDPGTQREEVLVVRRDSEGRITSIDARYGPDATWTVTLVRDGAGRISSERTSWTGRDGAAGSTLLTRTRDEAGRLTRIESTSRNRASAAEPEEESTTTATYEHGDACPADLVVPDEIDLLPYIDDRVDFDL